MSQESRRSAAEGGRPGAGTLTVDPETGYVGDTVTLCGAGLPGERSLDVVWHTVEGRWVVSDDETVTGQAYDPAERTVGTVRTDADGTVEWALTVPEDYGGEHAIDLRTVDGETVAGTTLTVHPRFELDRTTAPLGKAFGVTAYGLGTAVERSNYQVTWDNGVVGFVTGVENRGTAYANVRAAGPVGEHVIQVRRGPRGVPTLQDETQSSLGPVAAGRQSAWTVTVTEPDSEPETAWVDPLPEERPLDRFLPEVGADGDAELTITPTSGQAGTTATIEGEGFPPGAEVDLVWHRHEHDGNPAAGLTFSLVPKPDVLPTVTADADGRVRAEVTIPRGEGSTRPITAEVDGEALAVTGFVVQRSVVDVSPTEVPVGTAIRLEVSGIGWTEYERHIHVLYDNTPVGHICGTGFDFDREEATCWTELRAAGEPGWHFIDVYPTISETEGDVPDFEVTPLLSSRNNAPVRPFPIMHAAIRVTE